jgi:hypothetical protein
MSKHYIKIDENNNIIKSFTDAFESPDQDSIFVKENDRHFNLNIMGFDGIYNYKYENNEIVKKTIQEKENELNAIENKIKKVELIREKLLGKYQYVISVWNGQEYGMENNLNLHDRIITKENYDLWIQWFEKITHVFDTVDLQSISYKDIKIDNTDIFPIEPGFKPVEK